MKNHIRSLFAAVAVAGIAATAHAVPSYPTLDITSGASTTGVITGSAAGVGFSGVVGGWSVAYAAGSQNFGNDLLDLSSLDASTTSSTPLTLVLTGFDFTAVNNAVLESIGGTLTGATVSFWTYADPTDSGLYSGTPLASLVGLSGSSFSGDDQSSGPFSWGSSLTEVITITPTGSNGATSSFDASITAVPDSGTTAMLLGLGLVAVAFAARRMSVRA